MTTRHYRYIPCAKPDCQRLHRTSSTQVDHLCPDCQRAEHNSKCFDRMHGIITYDRRSSSIYVRPVPVMSVGQCQGPCRRNDQQLANGLCEDCRFWHGPDTDQEMSRRARLASPSHLRAYRGNK